MKRYLKKYLNILSILTIGLLSSAALFQTAAAIARGYNTNDTGLQTGMAVVISTESSDSSQIERATQDASQRVVGIVTTIDDSLVTVTSSSTKVLVESEGEVEAYTTDMNGEVKKGDSLVLSPLKGILMKGTDASATVIGVASADFSSASPEDYTIADDSKTKTVKIAKVKVNLNHQSVTSNIDKTDSSLSRIGRRVAGKDISEIRILVALIMFFLIMVVEGSILYGGISSSISALGRNPLARKIIRQELFRVVSIAIGVLLIGLGAIYSIVWV